MSKTIKTINKTRTIEKMLNGEKKFYAEYNSKIVIVNDQPKRIPELHIEWEDNRSLTDRMNNTPHFYYVALGERYESDSEEKRFLNKDKAEKYARQLYEDWKEEIEEETYYTLITHIVAFDD